MRNEKVCPKCNSRKIGRLSHVVDWDRGAVARRLAKGRVGRMTAYGTVEAYICTSCGYFEEYVKEPGKVPWHRVDGFSWVNES
ncbi:MAG: hypothetical protein AAFV53_32075 [Myxococcota bacterium]